MENEKAVETTQISSFKSWVPKLLYCGCFDQVQLIDNCDERRVYKSEDIPGPKGGTYMFNTSPKSSDCCLSSGIW